MKCLQNPFVDPALPCAAPESAPEPKSPAEDFHTIEARMLAELSNIVQEIDVRRAVAIINRASA
jgi:hypothetical protein